MSGGLVGTSGKHRLYAIELGKDTSDSGCIQQCTKKRLVLVAEIHPFTF